MSLIYCPYFYFPVKNLALNQSVSSSSLGLHGKHEYVVDGIYSPENGCEAALFYSDEGPSHWLRIDFGGWKNVGFVEVHNRNIPGRLDISRRLSNTMFYVYGESPTENRQLCAEIGDGGFYVFYLPCKKYLYGKGLEVFQPITGSKRYLNLCEVIVLGY